MTPNRIQAERAPRFNQANGGIAAVPGEMNPLNGEAARYELRFPPSSRSCCSGGTVGTSGHRKDCARANHRRGDGTCGESALICATRRLT